MSMPAVNIEIVTSYETLRMTPEQIAQDQDLDVAAVKAILLANSAGYRAQTTKEETKELFSQDDLRQAVGVMKTSLLEDDPHLRYRAARFIIDEVKGRNDARVQIPIDSSFNALELNQRLLAARQALEKGRQQKTLERPTNDGLKSGNRQAVHVIELEAIA